MKSSPTSICVKKKAHVSSFLNRPFSVRWVYVEWTRVPSFLNRPFSFRWACVGWLARAERFEFRVECCRTGPFTASPVGPTGELGWLDRLASRGGRGGGCLFRTSGASSVPGASACRWSVVGEAGNMYSYLHFTSPWYARGLLDLLISRIY